MVRLLKVNMLRRAIYTAQALLVVAVPVFMSVPQTAALGQLPNRSVIVGSSQPSVLTQHTYSFQFGTAANVGSIKFEYCSDTPFIGASCAAPAGLDVSAASLQSQSGNTGFSILAPSSTNVITLTRPSTIANGAATYAFGNITNPSAVGSVFVRITTYASTDATGAALDGSAVVFAIVRNFNVGGYVPPWMKLCVGLTVGDSCQSATGSNIDLGEFSKSQPNAAQSQFAIGSNSPTGYNVYALGTTMTSGNVTVPALSSPTASQPGTSQFGINLRSNTYPQVGSDVSGNGTGVPKTSYASQNLFTFVPGAAIAGSDLPSDYNRYTVSYLVNVSDAQKAGYYSTTITYLAITQF